MKNAVIYFGSLKSSFAQEQDWSRFSLGIFASEHLAEISGKLETFSYAPRDDNKLEEKIRSKLNNGIFLDWADPPKEYIDSLARRLHSQTKKLIINTGWGKNKRTEYSKADILLLESFLGANTGDDGKWPVKYYKTDSKQDIKRLKELKSKGYPVITLTYGPSDDIKFARHAHEIARANKSDYFIYCQAPGWEKQDSGFKLFRFNSGN